MLLYDVVCAASNAVATARDRRTSPKEKNSHCHARCWPIQNCKFGSKSSSNALKTGMKTCESKMPNVVFDTDSRCGQNKILLVT